MIPITIKKYLIGLLIVLVAVPVYSDMSFDDAKLWELIDSTYRLESSGTTEKNVYLFSSYACIHCKSIATASSAAAQANNFLVQQIHIPVFPFAKPDSISPHHMGAFFETVKKYDKLGAFQLIQLENYLYETYTSIKDEWLVKSKDPELSNGPRLAKVFQKKLISARVDVDAFLVDLGMDAITVKQLHESFGVSSLRKSYEKVYFENQKKLRESGASSEQFE